VAEIFGALPQLLSALSPQNSSLFANQLSERFCRFSRPSGHKPTLQVFHEDRNNGGSTTNATTLNSMAGDRCRHDLRYGDRPSGASSRADGHGQCLGGGRRSGECRNSFLRRQDSSSSADATAAVITTQSSASVGVAEAQARPYNSSIQLLWEQLQLSKQQQFQHRHLLQPQLCVVVLSVMDRRLTDRRT
jgi:hypothetical protein